MVPRVRRALGCAAGIYLPRHIHDTPVSVGFVWVTPCAACVKHQRELEPFLSQLDRQPAVAVEIDLQPEGAPGGHPDIAKAQIFIDEIEVVMETSALIWFQIGMGRLFVVPRFVCRARFHRGQDGDQAWLIATLLENLVDQPFFARLVATDKLNLDAVLGCQFLCVFPKLVAEWLGKTRIVEDPYLVGIEIPGHAIRMTEPGQGSLDDDSIEAAENAGNLWSISFCDQAHGWLPEGGFAKGTSTGSQNVCSLCF